MFSFLRKNNDETTVVGYQHITCMNPDCVFLLKKINYIKGWEKIIHTNGFDISLASANGTLYYTCPQCKARNIVVLQGEKIILEKIIRWELPDQSDNCSDVTGTPALLPVFDGRT